MKVVIDTNSLLSLVRYYLPFDKKGILFEFFKQKIASGDIIIIDKVLEECTYNSKGLVVSTLDYLQDHDFLKSAKVPYKTENLIAPAPTRFLNQLEHQFVNAVVRRQKNITDTEFENQKNAFLNDADLKQIILCLNLQKKGEEVILVTEETEHGNDNKLFKKIPAICHDLEILTKTLPQLLELYDSIDLDFKHNGAE